MKRASVNPAVVGGGAAIVASDRSNTNAEFDFEEHDGWVYGVMPEALTYMHIAAHSVLLNAMQWTVMLNKPHFIAISQIIVCWFFAARQMCVTCGCDA